MTKSLELDYAPTLEEVEHFGKAKREIMDILQKKYKFSLIQCAFFLTCTIDDLKETMLKAWANEKGKARE